MNTLRKTLVLAMLLPLGLAGCYNDALDPTQIGRFEPTPAVNVILETLGVADEPNPTYEGAEEPRPEDRVAYEQDYVFAAGDVVRISIFELYEPGQIYVNDYVVTETGRISIPDVGQVQAGGLTEVQLEQEIRDILSPAILKDPSVTAILLDSKSQVFSIVGQGVGQSARYTIPRYTFRLTDAIAQAGGIAEFNVTYIYVSREVPAEEATVQPSVAPAGIQESQTPPARPLKEIEMKPVEPKPQPTENEMLEMIAPSVIKKHSGIMISSAEMGGSEELEALAAPEGIDVAEMAPTQPVPQQEQAVQLQGQGEQIRWVFEDGKWKPIRTGVPSADALTATEPVSQQADDAMLQVRTPENQSSGFGPASLDTQGKVTRVIRIPRDRLLAGDPDYNIVIRPGDRITVPVDIIGEFWVMGNVNAQGAIPITGRPLTLKMAIASAGGLGPLAAPQKVEVVRRIGKNNAGLMQEETVLVDLSKISKGIQPDFFIKPYDLINVGTTGTSRWMAVLRNAFRATYGFGFIYDRNFATEDFDGDPFPGHFGFNSF